MNTLINLGQTSVEWLKQSLPFCVRLLSFVWRLRFQCSLGFLTAQTNLGPEENLWSCSVSLWFRNFLHYVSAYRPSFSNPNVSQMSELERYHVSCILWQQKQCRMDKTFSWGLSLSWAENVWMIYLDVDPCKWLVSFLDHPSLHRKSSREV